MVTTHFSCKICKLEVYNDEDVILCDLCNQWSYSINMTKNKFKNLENDILQWFCSICQKKKTF